MGKIDRERVRGRRETGERELRIFNYITIIPVSYTHLDVYKRQVSDLASVSLNKPVKIFVDSNQDVAFNLRQEFVK